MYWCNCFMDSTLKFLLLQIIIFVTFDWEPNVSLCSGRHILGIVCYNFVLFLRGDDGPRRSNRVGEDDLKEEKVKNTKEIRRKPRKRGAR